MGILKRKMQQKLETRVEFEDGLTLYYERHFAEAAVKFDMASKTNPNDVAHKLYLKRAAHFLGNGVPQDWDGVETLTDMH